jgi:hypothetical protein
MNPHPFVGTGVFAELEYPGHPGSFAPQIASFKQCRSTS